MKNPRKILLITILITLVATSVHAQYKRSGIKGGVNFSNLFIDKVNDENMRTGFNVGVFTQILDNSNSFGLQPELLYTTKGAKGEYNILAFSGEQKFNLNYLELPLLFVVKLGDDVDLNFGGYAGYLLNASVSTEGDFGDGYEKIDRDNFKSMDYGLAGGLALNLNAISVGVRYNYGLRKIADSDAADFFLGNSKNGVGQVYLGLNLGH